MVKTAINRRIKKVLLLGSGALKIGEAGEFDYSGSQAAKALKEEGIKTILINPNIATIQTSHHLAEKIYFLPVTPYFVEKVIEKENPEGILLGFGGQTALNCGLNLAKNHIFTKYNVQVLGTPVAVIEKTEDRLMFRQFIESLSLKVPQSILVKTTAEVEKYKSKLHFPVIVRAGFSLGGLGSGLARNYNELLSLAKSALNLTPQILIEEYLQNWKEVEYEIVRDSFDNTIIVCNMENMDPMGIHTGESIVVAPSQTLNNHEYQFFRETAIKIVKSLPIIGECNIQFALNPANGDWRIIELNARLSRSSALASKATGYPLAYIAAKLALGYKLTDIDNAVTKATSAFFEPALDYLVIKIPRWDFLKFKAMDMQLGTEMKSVGEVMSIGRTFGEAFQKAIRSLDIDYEGIISDELTKDKIGKKFKYFSFKSLKATPDRPYNIAFNLFHGQKVKDISSQTGIDPWFIERIFDIVKLYKEMLTGSQTKSLPRDLLMKAKKMGFSDKQIGQIYHKTPAHIRVKRKKLAIVPKVCQIDTLAGEFPAKTNYLYLSYNRSENDISKSQDKSIAIIGSGPYQIGSSVEFDWCCVSSVIAAKKLGYSPIVINSNPETVSTDYDISDRLYFEELSLERILDIADFEGCPFIVSVGGQIPNTLAPRLDKYGVKLLGTSSKNIDRAEDREKFSALLDRLTINQPLWRRLKSDTETIKFSESIGFPVLVRPSYVLSGKAMFVAYSRQQLLTFLKQTHEIVNSAYSLVISKFIKGSKEVDFDAVAQNGQLVVFAISEHVEHSGVHSGDATLVLPTFSLKNSSLKKIMNISGKIAASLNINGPFNIQFLVRENLPKPAEVLVIEANLRASRSFPFVSKVLGVNFINVATKIILGKKVKKISIKLPKYIGVKAPHFSFTRLRGADPILGVEMASTGEVAAIGENLNEAYLKAVLSTGVALPENSVLLSLGGQEGKKRLLQSARILHDMGFNIFATGGTSQFLKEHHVPSEFVFKVAEGSPNVIDIISKKKVSLVINLSDKNDLALKTIIKQNTDGYLIRRAAVDANIPLFTKATIANLFVDSMSKLSLDDLKIKSWNEYVRNLHIM